MPDPVTLTSFADLDQVVELVDSDQLIVVQPVDGTLTARRGSLTQARGKLVRPGRNVTISSDGTIAAAGTIWWNSTSAPSALVGENGDYHVNTLNGFFYQKLSGTWTQIGTITPTVAPTNGFLWAFSAATADADPGTGHFRLNHATQGLATAIYVSLINDSGQTITVWLDSLADSTNTQKGRMRLTSQTNPARWLDAAVTGVTTASGYRKIEITVQSQSGADPLVANEQVWLSFTPTGDVPTGPFPTVEITEDTALSLLEHCGKALKCRNGVTITGAYEDLGDGFICTILNRSGQNVVMGGMRNIQEATRIINGGTGIVIASGGATPDDNEVTWLADKVL